MIWLLSALVAIGIILSIVTGPIGLALTLPAALGLYLVLRSRQSPPPVDQRFVGGAQPDRTGPPDSQR